MAEPQPQTEHGDEDLRGTFAIVLIIGAIILVVWLSVFLLFLSRL
jgi:hypothetical protein